MKIFVNAMRTLGGWPNSYFNNELLCKIAQIYEGASYAKFSQWATINLYDKVVQQVKELRVIDKSALDEKLWMCELMIRQSNAKYDAMVAAGRYTSATTQKTDEQTMAHGYLAAMNAAVETLKQVAFEDKSKRGTSNGSSGSGKCKKCFKEGHHAADCPTADTGATSSSTITHNQWEERNIQRW